MELQIVSDDHTLVTFWQQRPGKPNSFLASLGFGSGDIRGLDVDKEVRIPDSVHFDTFLTKDSKAYLYYKGESLLGKCEKTNYIVYPQIIFMAPSQVKEMRSANGLLGGAGHAKKARYNKSGFWMRGRSKKKMIYQNYEKPSDPKHKTLTKRPEHHAKKAVSKKGKKDKGKKAENKKKKGSKKSDAKVKKKHKKKGKTGKGKKSTPKKAKKSKSQPKKNHSKSKKKPVNKPHRGHRDQTVSSKEIKFDMNSFSYFYRTYPPTRVKNKPPADPKKYPSPRYPYPDTFRWTGEPNFPNDPLYPDFLFPPQPPMTTKSAEDVSIDWKHHEWPTQWPTKLIPKVVKNGMVRQTLNSPVFSLLAQIPKISGEGEQKPNGGGNGYPDDGIPALMDDPAFFDPNYDPFKNDPFFKENPEEPDFGYPVWPDGVHPSFPAYSPSFPTKEDPPIVIYDPPYVLTVVPPRPRRPKPPKYGRRPPQRPGRSPRLSQPGRPGSPLFGKPPKRGTPPPRQRPQRPRRRRPRYPKKPRIRPNLPPTHVIPRRPIREPDEPNQIDHPPLRHKPEYPRDPRLKWPQNPFYTWPKDPDYKYPQNPRFKYPTDPRSPKYPWPRDPRRDPRWHNPPDKSWLPHPRAPKHPRKPPKKGFKPDLPIYNPKKASPGPVKQRPRPVNGRPVRGPRNPGSSPKQPENSPAKKKPKKRGKKPGKNGIPPKNSPKGKKISPKKGGPQNKPGHPKSPQKGKKGPNHPRADTGTPKKPSKRKPKSSKNPGQGKPGRSAKPGKTGKRPPGHPKRPKTAHGGKPPSGKGKGKNPSQKPKKPTEGSPTQNKNPINKPKGPQKKKNPKNQPKKKNKKKSPPKAPEDFNPFVVPTNKPQHKKPKRSKRPPTHTRRRRIPIPTTTNPSSPNPPKGNNNKNLPPMNPKKKPPIKISPAVLPPYYFNPYNPAPRPDTHLPPPKPRPYIIPPPPKKPASRPEFTAPKPNFVYSIPHRPPPFPAPKPFIPSVYKGVPNQPLGLIPPAAIPFWRPKPNGVAFLRKRKPPRPDKKGKWVPYFHYPIPFKHKKTHHPVYAPQFIYVPKGYRPPKNAKKAPDYVPVLIKPPISSKRPYPKNSGLVPYKMPVLRKPVDPRLRPKLKHYRKLKKVRKERLRRNKKLKKNAKKKKKYRPRACKRTQIFCRRVEMRNFKANKATALRRVKNICQTSADKELCFKKGKIRLLAKHPEYNSDYPTIPIYNPLKYRFLGFKRKCAEFYIGVVMNRHFIHKHQWRIKDYTYDKHGRIVYCEKYVTGPVFERINPLLVPEEGAGRGGKKVDPVKKRISHKLTREDIIQLCRRNLSTVLNLKTSEEAKWHRDKVMKQCMLQFGDGEVDKLGEYKVNHLTEDVKGLL